MQMYSYNGFVSDEREMWGGGGVSSQYKELPSTTSAAEVQENVKEVKFNSWQVRLLSSAAAWWQLQIDGVLLVPLLLPILLFKETPSFRAPEDGPDISRERVLKGGIPYCDVYWKWQHLLALPPTIWVRSRWKCVSLKCHVASLPQIWCREALNDLKCWGRRTFLALQKREKTQRT